MFRHRFFPISLLLVIIFESLPTLSLYAQPGDSLNSYIDVAKIYLAEKIDKKVDFTYIEAKENLAEKYDSLVFNNGLIHKKFVPGKYVTKKPILRFNVYNS